MDGVIVRIPKSKDTGVPLGFLFVRGDTDGIERFVHRSSCVRGVSFERLRVHQRVRFEPVPDTPQGPRATDLMTLES